jgi:hypothetical protein
MTSRRGGRALTELFPFPAYTIGGGTEQTSVPKCARVFPGTEGNRREQNREPRLGPCLSPRRGAP